MGSLFTKTPNIDNNLNPATTSSCWSKCCNTIEQDMDNMGPQLEKYLSPIVQKEVGILEDKLTNLIQSKIDELNEKIPA